MRVVDLYDLVMNESEFLENPEKRTIIIKNAGIVYNDFSNSKNYGSQCSIGLRPGIADKLSAEGWNIKVREITTPEGDILKLPYIDVVAYSPRSQYLPVYKFYDSFEDLAEGSPFRPDNGKEIDISSTPEFVDNIIWRCSNIEITIKANYNELKGTNKGYINAFRAVNSGSMGFDREAGFSSMD